VEQGETMTYEAIKEGDRVTVYFDGSYTYPINGVVRHMAQATGECWVIETDNSFQYVQTFQRIEKEKGGADVRF
jgi:multidrug resistance efflux pump